MRWGWCLGFVLALGGWARGQEEAPPGGAAPDALEQRLAEQERALDALRREVESLRGGAAATPAPAAEAASEGAAAQPAEVPWTEKFRLGAFYIESADGDHRLTLNARVHLDARYDLAADFFDNTFQVRRARLEAQGRLFRHVEYKLGLEFGRTAGANLRDGWIKLVFMKELQVWAGQMLLPFSTERLTSSNYMKHPERPIIVGDLLDSREIGVQVGGELFDGVLRYYAGVFNGNGQNQRLDTDDDKDLAGRLELHPTKWLLLSANYVLSPTNRSAGGPSDEHTVGDEGSLFLDYGPGLRRLGRRQRLGAGARVRTGPVQVASEWIADMEEDVAAPNGQEDHLLVWEWFLDASFVLTGEDEADSIAPAHPLFGGEERGVGAFELSARFEHFEAPSRVIRHGFAVGTDRLESGTATLTWIPVQGVRAMVSYTGSVFEDAVLDRSGDRRWSDHVMVLRLALFF